MKLDYFQLKDFGRSEYRDSLVPVNILMVLIGFCILLFNQIVVFWGDPVRVSSVVCGSSYLIAYMFYLTEYYEKIWAPYYALPSDKMFFRMYSLLIGIVVITLMQNFPEFWYLYTLFLLIVMYIKKRITRQEFQHAFNKHCNNNFHQCSDKKLQAKYVLSEAFTVNFFKYGVVFNTIYSFGLYVLYKHNPTDNIELITGVFMPINYFVVTSCSITLLIVCFWIKKVSTGLTVMANKIEEGDYEYFNDKM